MTNSFAALDSMLSRAVDSRLGELLRFVPKPRRDNYGQPLGAADGRLTVDVTGTFIEGSSDLDFLAGDKRDSGFSGRIVNHHAWATAERNAFELGNAPKKGDQVITIDQPKIETFEIVDVLSDGSTRWAFPLVRAS